MLQSMGLQRVGHNLENEQQLPSLVSKKFIISALMTYFNSRIVHKCVCGFMFNSCVCRFYTLSVIDFPGAQMVKCLPTMWETQVQSLGWEDLLEEEMATCSGIVQ